jgi:hypothetical protein
MNNYDRTKAHEKLLKQCLLQLTTHGYMAWKNSTGALKANTGHFQRYGLKGSADIIGLTPEGQFLAIEIKTGKAVQNKAQVSFQKAIESRNGIYKIIRTYEELIEWLELMIS